MRPINEARMRARWKLGRALKAVQREPEGRPKNTVQVVNSFWKWVTKQLGLERATVVEAQRIGTLPEDKLIKAFEEAADQLEQRAASVQGRPNVPSRVHIYPAPAPPRGINRDRREHPSGPGLDRG
jgi:hypothetical protein